MRKHRHVEPHPNHRTVASQTSDRSTDLTVRLLAASAGGRAAELLGLAATGVRHQQSPVVRQEDGLDLVLGGLVLVCRARHTLVRATTLRSTHGQAATTSRDQARGTNTR